MDTSTISITPELVGRSANGYGLGDKVTVRGWIDAWVITQILLWDGQVRFHLRSAIPDYSTGFVTTYGTLTPNERDRYVWISAVTEEMKLVSRFEDVFHGVVRELHARFPVLRNPMLVDDLRHLLASSYAGPGEGQSDHDNLLVQMENKLFDLSWAEIPSAERVALIQSLGKGDAYAPGDEEILTLWDRWYAGRWTSRDGDIYIAQIPEGFVCKGEVWASSMELAKSIRRFWPTALFRVEKADDAVRAFWQDSLRTGKAKIRTQA